MATEAQWIDVNDALPDASVWVMAWLYLPLNPIASAHVVAQYSGFENDEPTEYGVMRMTKHCWWANGRYYAAGHVTHWMPLPTPPTAARKGE